MEEEEEEEEQKGPDLKQASRRDMYSICQSAGLGLYILHKNNSMYFFLLFIYAGSQMCQTYSLAKKLDYIECKLTAIH